MSVTSVRLRAMEDTKHFPVLDISTKTISNEWGPVTRLYT